VGAVLTPASQDNVLPGSNAADWVAHRSALVSKALMVRLVPLEQPAAVVCVFRLRANPFVLAHAARIPLVLRAGLARRLQVTEWPAFRRLKAAI
jgi:hypothetical protein